jgi:hypothetical protein
VLKVLMTDMKCDERTPRTFPLMTDACSEKKGEKTLFLNCINTVYATMNEKYVSGY